jgi:hypothetical protein
VGLFGEDGGESGEDKFAEFMANAIRGNFNGEKGVTVVDKDGVVEEGGGNGSGSFMENMSFSAGSGHLI